MSLALDARVVDGTAAVTQHFAGAAVQARRNTVCRAVHFRCGVVWLREDPIRAITFKLEDRLPEGKCEAPEALCHQNIVSGERKGG